jgi:hypothetical protein
MSEFLKFAFELISQILYNVIAWLVSIFTGLLKIFVTGVPDYAAIFDSYFSTVGFFGKLFSILLVVILIAIPLLLIGLLIRKIVVNIRLKAQADDNVSLYKEIGRLNRQIMQLMDEKSMILNLKTGAGVAAQAGLFDEDEHAKLQPLPVEVTSINSPGTVGVAGAVGGVSSGMVDPLAETPDGVAVGGVIPGGVVPGVAVGGGMGGGSLNEKSITEAAAAAAAASAQARSKAEEAERNTVQRFPKLSLVDTKYEHFDEPEFNDTINLEQFAENYRLFAASQMHLFYTPEIVRRFVAGMAASKLLILEGISGTGKTSLPYSFSRYLGYPATLVSVQPSYRDKTELLGYFNEFSKRFNETEFLRALYEAGYREEPAMIVLDEMNLARIEYYFAEMLSVLEMPDQSEWVVDLVPTAWPGDPVRLNSGKITVSPNTWFIGTANNDDSTFTITDKVYDRAMPIELNERAAAFECELQPRSPVTYAHLLDLFTKAKAENPISEGAMTKLVKLDQYLQTRFRLAFGNRIMKQLYDFIPVYVACGGKEIDGLDYIIARKVLKKFESTNIAFVRDEIKGLISYIDKTFGETHMNDSRAYLTRIQNLY